MACEPAARVRPTRIPALGVDAVKADQLDPALIQVVRERADHSAILVLVEAALRGWENDHRSAGVAEGQQLHRTAERGAIPAMVCTMHRQALISCFARRGWGFVI